MASGGTQAFNFSQFGVQFTIAGTLSDASQLVTNLVNTSNDLVQTGAGCSLTLQVEANNGQTLSVSIADAQASGIGNGGGHASLNAAVTAFDGDKSCEAANLMQSVGQAITDIDGNFTRGILKSPEGLIIMLDLVEAFVDCLAEAT